MSNRLFVGNLSFHTTEDMLAQTFQQYGEVSEVKLILDRETGRSRGFAFVTMKSDEDAQKATQNLDGAMLDGRTLRVNEAEDRRPRPSFGGGGGGPGGGGGGFRGGGGGGGGGGYRGGGGGGGGGGGFGGGGGGGDRRGGGRGGRGGDERRGGRDRDRGNRW